MNDLSPIERSTRAAQKPRISQKLRTALVLIAQEGATQASAAQRAGLDHTHVCKALKKPHVAEELERLKSQVVETIESLKGHYRTLALEHAWHLAKHAKSEAVQARMVEFLAGEPRAGSQVNVQVNVDRGGYEYVPPGAEVVEVSSRPTDE